MKRYITITGHRELSQNESKRIVWAFEEILKKELCGKSFFCAQMADGADQLLAEAALKNKHKVLAVIPMGIGEFCSKDLNNKAEFEAILNHPDSRSEIIKIQQNEDHFERKTRDLYYRRANDYMLARSRKVIAVWDGQKAKSDAGTGAVVEKAIEGGISVYWIPSKKDIDFHYLDIKKIRHIEKKGYYVLSK